MKYNSGVHNGTKGMVSSDMSVIKSFFIAFSMYSKIPVPQFDWKEHDMRYVMCFFPLVGVVIGIAEVLWYLVVLRAGLGTVAGSTVAIAIPVAISGGIHIDGFMDTMDAFHSYGSLEKKLDILKDPHIGAFSVIMLALYGLICFAAWSEVSGLYEILAISEGFWLSRILSAVSVISFPKAKRDGTVAEFAQKADSVKKRIFVLLILQMVLCCGSIIMVSRFFGVAVVIASFLTFALYGRTAIKQIGGVTGDTSGYFLVCCECAQVVVTAVAATCMRLM